MIIYKILFFVLMFSILNVVKDIASFILSFISNERASFSKTRMIFLGLSLSYILTIIFTGLKI